MERTRGMGYLSSEWRRFRRVIPQSGTPLAVQVDEPAGMGEVAVRDLGEGGMELQTSVGDPAWLGGPVRLRLTLPGGSIVPVQGRVRHVEANRVGVVFEQLLAADRELVRLYVERIAGESWWSRLRRMLQGG